MKMYRMTGGSGYPIDAEISKSPIPGLEKHLRLPALTSDVAGFTSKYVESFANLNRAWFANDELVKAYDSIPYKAIDVEHETSQVVGHIFSHAFVNRATNTMVELADLQKFSPEELNNTPLDVLIASVVYTERFPQLESTLGRKAWAMSMEALFRDFDILLENGVRLNQAEAVAMGLEDFIDQLMGAFESEEDFRQAHSLEVTTADARTQVIKVYKYLKDITFSGGGLVMVPACPSCQILSTSLDEQGAEVPCGCSAAIQTGTSKIHKIDLRQVESYMKKTRDSGETGPINHQVAVDLQKEEALSGEPDSVGPVTGPFSMTPNIPAKGPAMCPQYKTSWQEGGSNIVRQHWCLYAESNCTTAGDRSWHDCLRWYQRGEDYIFDPRSKRDPNYSPERISQPDPVEASEDDTAASEANKFDRVKRVIESFTHFLETLSLAKVETEEESELETAGKAHRTKSAAKPGSLVRG